MAMSRPLRDNLQLSCIDVSTDKQNLNSLLRSTCQEILQGHGHMSKAERISLAKKIKEQQGCFESEISFHESDLHEFEDNCDKNPGHLKFIPIDQFKMIQLPLKYQKLNIYNLIKALEYLTVRVEVNCKSPYTDEVMCAIPVRYGSGRIFNIKKFKYMGDDQLKCPCIKCVKGDSAKQWLQITVITAKHIVSNDLEAANTNVKLGYNNYRSNFFTFEAVRGNFSPSQDWCMLTCITHDVSAYREIGSKLSCYKTYALELYKTYRATNKKEKLVIIVSHPHGCRKQISFGYWCKRDQQGGVDIKYTYTAATCNGSSGAPVFILGRDGREGLYPHIHSGCDVRNFMKEKDKGDVSINFSCCIPG